MTEAELRKHLREEPAPGEPEAEERAWQIVRPAFATRDRVPWLERHSRLVVVLALVAALAVAAVSPPGRAVVDTVRDKVAGKTTTEPALIRLPTASRLLVDSPQGSWIVRADGSKRRLGAYEASSWSPRGLFVVATRGHSVVALEPDGDVRWTITRPDQVAQARWAPSGFRVAYRERATLRVVVGNGEGDHLLLDGIAPVAPAWRPDTQRNQLAYVDRAGRVHVVDVDTRDDLLSVPVHRSVEKLLWADGGRRLIVLSQRPADIDRTTGGIRVVGTPSLPSGHRVLDGAVLSRGLFVYADYNARTNRTDLVQVTCVTSDPCLLIGPVRIFRGEGKLENLVVSPDGQWLYVGWAAADEALFLRTPGVRKLVTVPNISGEFDPGGVAPRDFPRVAGWVGAPMG